MSYLWVVDIPMRGMHTCMVTARTRKEAIEKARRHKYDPIDFNITWSGVARIVSKRERVKIKTPPQKESHEMP